MEWSENIPQHTANNYYVSKKYLTKRYHFGQQFRSSILCVLRHHYFGNFQSVNLLQKPICYCSDAQNDHVRGVFLICHLTVHSAWPSPSYHHEHHWHAAHALLSLTKEFNRWHTFLYSAPMALFQVLHIYNSIQHQLYTTSGELHISCLPLMKSHGRLLTSLENLYNPP